MLEHDLDNRGSIKSIAFEQTLIFLFIVMTWMCSVLCNHTNKAAEIDLDSQSEL